MTTTGRAGASGRARRGERGFALVLAILSLMLLTFLGLTLAATTSTELQIATNYRWSQQALYNAEAGLEAARIVLSRVADPTSKWQLQLPQARSGEWDPGSAPVPKETPSGRDFEKKSCDSWGGIGYGLVLREGTTPYQDVSTFGGASLNGAFTVWVRRLLITSVAGQFSDSTSDDSLIIVSEGVAPFVGPSDAFTRARQATRVLETSYALVLASTGEPCGLGRMQGQEGGSPMGENFNPCANLTAGATGSLANVFGGAGAGGLTANPNVP
jgi:hypothetical protein